MTAIHVEHTKGPIGDPVTGLLPPDAWDLFETAGAQAFVLRRPDGTFLLHWIESWFKGSGTELLRAIGVWADEHRMQGRLTCELKLARFYQRGGWEVVGPWGLPGYVEMWRQPS
jgi:hypothetical protein